MTDKNEPKIRMVTLDKKSPAENSGSRAKLCRTITPTYPPSCSCHDRFECKCMCKPMESPCLCEFKVPPTPQPGPCNYEVPCSNKTIPSTPKSENNRKEQQTPKEGKGKPRTFFKIAENKK